MYRQKALKKMNLLKQSLKAFGSSIFSLSENRVKRLKKAKVVANRYQTVVSRLDDESYRVTVI